MTLVVALSGWRGWVDVQDREWLCRQVRSWGEMLGQGIGVFWRVGDEPNGFDDCATGLLQDVNASFCVYRADWSLPGGAGGPVRSLHMLQGRNVADRFQGRRADFLLAFPQPGKRVPKHGEVSGTWRCIELAKQHGVTFIVPGYRKPEVEGLF